MQNILHAIDTGGPGGAETVFLNLATGLDNSEYRSIAAIKGDDWLAGQLRARGMEPLFIDSKGAFNLKYLWQIIKIIKKHNIDIIQSHLFGSNVYCSLAGLICRIPVISVFHGNVDVDPEDKLVKIKFKIILAGSKKLVFVSDHLKKFITEQYRLPTTKCTTIHNGVALDKFNQQTSRELKKELGIPDNDILIGAVGNIRKAKAYDILIKAAALLTKSSPHYKFVITGQGSNSLEQELQQLVTELDLQNHVFFLGFQSDTPRILRNLDIFVQSSSSEGFSISIVEAMASKLPIVATRSGGPEEILTHDQNAIMVETGNPEKIATAIESLVEDAVLRKRLSQNAFEHAHETFSIEAMLSKYRKLYMAL